MIGYMVFKDGKIKMKINKDKAFTLIEVMVATIVIVVSLLGTLSLFNREASLVTVVKDESIVTYAIQEQIELIRRTSYADVITAYSSPTSFSTAGFAFLSNPSGTITLDYPFGAVSPNDKIVRVNISLSWLSANNRPKTKTIATYVADGGMGD